MFQKILSILCIIICMQTLSSCEEEVVTEYVSDSKLKVFRIENINQVTELNNIRELYFSGEEYLEHIREIFDRKDEFNYYFSYDQEGRIIDLECERENFHMLAQFIYDDTGKITTIREVSNMLVNGSLINTTNMYGFFYEKDASLPFLMINQDFDLTMFEYDEENRITSIEIADSQGTNFTSEYIYTSLTTPIGNYFENTVIGHYITSLISSKHIFAPLYGAAHEKEYINGILGSQSFYINSQNDKGDIERMQVTTKYMTSIFTFEYDSFLED